MDFRRFLAVLAVVAVFAAVFTYSAPARVRILYALGRAGVCPLERVLDAPASLQRQIDLNNQILAASSRVENDGGYQLWDTPDGRYWVPEGSSYVLPFNLAEQDREVYFSGEVRVRPGDIVLDCGANVGVFTRKALNEGAAKVVAVEPAPENLVALRRNFEKEIAAGTVIVYPKGVWDKEDELTFFVNPKNSTADSFVFESEGSRPLEQKVPLTTVDNLVMELGLERVDFIKMAIEGAEVQALHGARATLVRFHPRLAVSVDHRDDDPVEVPRAIFAAWAGYTEICGPCTETRWRVRPDVLLFH